MYKGALLRISEAIKSLKLQVTYLIYSIVVGYVADSIRRGTILCQAYYIGSYYGNIGSYYRLYEVVAPENCT